VVPDYRRFWKLESVALGRPQDARLFYAPNLRSRRQFFTPGTGPGDYGCALVLSQATYLSIALEKHGGEVEELASYQCRSCTTSGHFEPAWPES
jgi:hypothetical protein